MFSQLKNFYTTILCQAFSPCGNYLVVGDIHGRLTIFYLGKLLHPEGLLNKDDQKPRNQCTIVEEEQINSLITTQDHLIVGTIGQILAYTWKNIKSIGKITCVWSIDVSSIRDSFEKPEINYLVYNEEKNALYAGCGDNNIYVFNIETRKIITTLKGHKNYIHSLALHNERLVSGGEDGQVLLWDTRESSFSSKIEPGQKNKVCRPELGSWIGSVSLNEDWLLCGGGPRLSLWHLRSMNVSTVFPIDDRGIHVAEIYEEKILAGGSSNYFYNMSFNGEINTEIPTSSVTTYSAIHHKSPFEVLCIAGSSPKIDVCNNFNYKNLQLSLMN